MRKLNPLNFAPTYWIHFTPRKYWLITQEAMAPSRHDWKIVDWDVKPQHKPTNQLTEFIIYLTTSIYENQLYWIVRFPFSSDLTC